MKKRVFISFDYDHDSDIKGSLVAQARNDDSPFEIVDMSIKEAIDQNWKSYARKRIKGCDCVIVLCGFNTDTAKGVTAELSIAQEKAPVIEDTIRWLDIYFSRRHSGFYTEV